MKTMKAKEIITDLTYYDSVKSFRKTLLDMTLTFMADDEIDDRSDVYSFYTVLDNHLRQIGKYQKSKKKNDLD
jgi:hypothetical protein